MQLNQKNQSGHTALLALLGIVVVAGIVVVGLRVHDQMASKTVNLGAGPTVAASSKPATAASTPSTTIPAGSSNANLSSDLSSINSSITQDNGNVTAANSAINDQQNEITVPTN